MATEQILSRTATLSLGSQFVPDLRLHYREGRPSGGGNGKGVIVLIHGFPETSYQFKHVIPLFAQAGYRVIAPDTRGAGDSSKPLSGHYPGQNYRKSVIAEDIHRLLHEELGIKEKVHLVGHDIGGMITPAYAMLYPDDLKSVIWGECPLPGSTSYEKNKGSVELFHFVFHSIHDLPEALVQGKERTYLEHFYRKLGYNQAAFSKEDIDEYERAFAQPGALRAGFDLYRAFEADAEENRKWRDQKGKCKVPSLCLMGKQSFLQYMSEDMTSEFFEGGKCDTVENAGHWIAEENPQGFVEAVLSFVSQKS